jgi:hypothetical protein
MSLMRTAFVLVTGDRKYGPAGDGANSDVLASYCRNTRISDRESSPALSRSLSMSRER